MSPEVKDLQVSTRGGGNLSKVRGRIENVWKNLSATPKNIASLCQSSRIFRRYTNSLKYLEKYICGCCVQFRVQV